MSRKHCETCDGRGYTHVPPCYWDPARPFDGWIHNPPPPCGCSMPRCTDCAGSGIRTALPEGGKLVPVRMTLFFDTPEAESFYVMLRAKNNYWTARVTPVSAPASIKAGITFEAFFQLAVAEAEDQLVSGSLWPLFYPKKIGQMEVL